MDRSYGYVVAALYGVLWPRQLGCRQVPDAQKVGVRLMICPRCGAAMAAQQVEVRVPWHGPGGPVYVAGQGVEKAHCPACGYETLTPEARSTIAWVLQEVQECALVSNYGWEGDME